VTLAILGLAAAIFSGFSHRYFSSPMATAVKGEAATISISLVPHLGLPLALSGLTIALGVVVYWKLDYARYFASRLLLGLGPGPDRGFDGFISGLVRLSRAVTRFVQPGRLEAYVTFTFLCLAAVLLVPPALYGEFPAMPVWPSHIPLYEAAIFVIAVIGLAAVIVTRDRLTAIVSLGIQGFALALIFLMFGAPDLSFTQFMVETLSVVILTLVMTRLKLSPVDRRLPVRMLFDGAIAIACGLGFTLLLLKATEAPFDTRLSDFFNHYSKLIAHGQNVVNVIIVDFRGTDTLGEIAVVTITGLAILSLIRLRAGPGRSLADNDPDRTEGSR
jgi:multicomponent Na+:H+ antiporter subunit A